MGHLVVQRLVPGVPQRPQRIDELVDAGLGEEREQRHHTRPRHVTQHGPTAAETPAVHRDHANSQRHLAYGLTRLTGVHEPVIDHPYGHADELHHKAAATVDIHGDRGIIAAELRLHDDQKQDDRWYAEDEAVDQRRG